MNQGSDRNSTGPPIGTSGSPPVDPEPFCLARQRLPCLQHSRTPSAGVALHASAGHNPSLGPERLGPDQSGTDGRTAEWHGRPGVVPEGSFWGGSPDWQSHGVKDSGPM